MCRSYGGVRNILLSLATWMIDSPAAAQYYHHSLFSTIRRRLRSEIDLNIDQKRIQT